MQLGEPPQLPQFVEWHFAVQISRPDGGNPSDHDRKLGVGVAVTAGQVRTSNHSNSTLILGWETSGSCCGICILKDFSILLSSSIITPSTLEWAVPSSYLPPFFSATYCFQTLCFHHQGQWHSLEISSIYTPSRPTFSKRRQCSILFHHGHWVRVHFAHNAVKQHGSTWVRPRQHHPFQTMKPQLDSQNLQNKKHLLHHFLATLPPFWDVFI